MRETTIMVHGAVEGHGREALLACVLVLHRVRAFIPMDVDAVDADEGPVEAEDEVVRHRLLQLLLVLRRRNKLRVNLLPKPGAEIPEALTHRRRGHGGELLDAVEAGAAAEHAQHAEDGDLRRDAVPPGAVGLHFSS